MIQILLLKSSEPKKSKDHDQKFDFCLNLSVCWQSNSVNKAVPLEWVPLNLQGFYLSVQKKSAISRSEFIPHICRKKHEQDISRKPTNPVHQNALPSLILSLEYQPIISEQRPKVNIFSADSRISVTQSANISRWSLLISVRINLRKKADNI